MTRCDKCGADIAWRKNMNNKWVPFNIEDIEQNDEYDESIKPHFDTCKPPKPTPLTREQLQRPGYL